jgi:hypothetical protein
VILIHNPDRDVHQARIWWHARGRIDLCLRRRLMRGWAVRETGTALRLDEDVLMRTPVLLRTERWMLSKELAPILISKQTYVMY